MFYKLYRNANIIICAFVFLEVYHAVWGASLYLYSCCLYLYLPLLFAEVLVAIMQLGGGPLIIWACRFLPSK